MNIMRGRTVMYRVTLRFEDGNATIDISGGYGMYVENAFIGANLEHSDPVLFPPSKYSAKPDPT